MAETLIVPCPAKVNLFLAVGPRDSLGYHPLRTIFQAVNLCDTLEISVGAESSFLCDDPSVPVENTVTKALRSAAEVVTLPPLAITLRKVIPAESGLGGGSSDAAGLLRALAQLVEFPVGEVERIALAVGADVPFFLCGGRAKAEGYGERLTPLPDRETEWFVIARPEVGCPTGEAYRRLDETSYEWREFPADDALYNDFERVAPCECLDLIERLQVHGARDAALSGSGSTVFGRFSTQSAAEAVKEKLAAEGVGRLWVARSLSRSESLAITSKGS